MRFREGDVRSGPPSAFVRFLSANFEIVGEGMPSRGSRIGPAKSPQSIGFD
jgi:hypothetical protein